jgi:glycosyltransferase involved in cell wall biosynthesis
MDTTRSCSPRVSILLPFRNAALTLEAALRSVQAQTLADWELILVDDGSSDDSADLAASVACEDSRVCLVRRRHGGLVASLNEAIARSTAPVLARMDADDLMHPDRLQAQWEHLDRHPEIGVVGSLVEFGGDPEAQAGFAMHVDWLNSLVDPDVIALNRFIESPLAHPSVMFRKCLVDAFGGYRDGSFPEDYELWLRWIDAGVRVAKVPRALLTWRDFPGRLTRTDPRYGAERFFELKAPWLARELERCLGGRRVWVWGAGRPTRVRAAHLERHGTRIDGFVDIDPRKQGRIIHGRRVHAPGEIPSPRDVVVLGYVARRGARELARRTLSGHGFVEGRDAWMAA